MYYDDMAIRIGGPERSALRTPLSVAVYRQPQRFGVGAVLVEDGKASLFASGGLNEDEESPALMAEALGMCLRFACGEGGIRSRDVEIATNDYELYGTVCRFLDGEPVPSEISRELREAFNRTSEMGIRPSIRLQSITRDTDSGDVGVAVALDLAALGSRGWSVAAPGVDLPLASRFAWLAGVAGRHSVDSRSASTSMITERECELFERWARGSSAAEHFASSPRSLSDDVVDASAADVYVESLRGPSRSAIGFLLVDGDDFHAGAFGATKLSAAFSSMEGQVERILERRDSGNVRLHGAPAMLADLRARLVSAGYGARIATEPSILHAARSQCAFEFADYAFTTGRRFRTGGRVRSLLSEVERHSVKAEGQVTVTCDASIGDKATGLGIVIEKDRKGLTVGRKVDPVVGSDEDRSRVGEAIAAYEGLRLALDVFPETRRVRLVSDSISWMRVLDQVSRGRQIQTSDTVLVEWVNRIRDLARRKRLFVDWEWTRAHTVNVDRRSIANDIADRLSLAARLGTEIRSGLSSSWRGEALDRLRIPESQQFGAARRSTVRAMLPMTDAMEQSGLDRGTIFDLVRNGHLVADYVEGTIQRDSLVRLTDELERYRRPRRRERVGRGRVDVVVSACRKAGGDGYGVFAAHSDASIARAGFLPKGESGVEIFEGVDLRELFVGMKSLRLVVDETFNRAMPDAFDETIHRLRQAGVEVDFAMHGDPEFSTGEGLSLVTAARRMAEGGGRQSFQRMRRDGDWVLLASAVERFLPRLDAGVSPGAVPLDDAEEHVDYGESSDRGMLSR